MPETTILIKDATANERRLAKGMLDLVKRREQLVQRIASYQAEVVADQERLAAVDGDLLPALEAVFVGRGWASIDSVELLLDADTGKPSGLKLTHP